MTAVLFNAATENADVRKITLIRISSTPLLKTDLDLLSLPIAVININ